MRSPNEHHHDILKSVLLAHVHSRGMLSLTTDGWSASNATDVQAITLSWTDDKWNRRDIMFDIIHLKEPMHSGNYFAEHLLAVANDFDITGAVLLSVETMPPTTLLCKRRSETATAGVDWAVEQSWTFTVKENDVRCMAHIINLAVRVALRMFKAVPAEDCTADRCEDNAAQVPNEALHVSPVTGCLKKLRRHIYVFRDRRA